MHDGRCKPWKSSLTIRYVVSVRSVNYQEDPTWIVGRETFLYLPYCWPALDYRRGPVVGYAKDIHAYGNTARALTTCK